MLRGLRDAQCNNIKESPRISTASSTSILFAVFLGDNFSQSWNEKLFSKVVHPLDKQTRIPLQSIMLG